MTAARPSCGAAAAAPFVFFSHSGPRPLAVLGAELARRGLRPQDLLRLRSFAPTPDDVLAFERELGELLPRSQWPALTSVMLTGKATRRQTVDAIAAPRAHRERELVQAGKTLRFGDWVFVGALASADPAQPHLPGRIPRQALAGRIPRQALAGRIPRQALAGRIPRQALAGRIEHQACSLFEQMQTALAAAGTQLRDVVKVGGWLNFPMSEYEPLGNVRSELLERARLLPASSAVQIGTPPDAHARLLAFEAIAFAGLSKRQDEHLQRSSLAPYYADARHAGDYVFASGEIPRRAGPLRAQVDDVYVQLREHIARYGARLQDAVHQTVYVRHTEQLPAVEERVRAWLGAPPPTTVVPALDMGFCAGMDVEIELIADARS